MQSGAAAVPGEDLPVWGRDDDRAKPEATDRGLERVEVVLACVARVGPEGVEG
jgi:hypothetical protein